ncbi:MAG: hypothetical protein ACFFBD_00165, partial [Candidatus Hodarchaeota archaeon]
MAELIQFEGIPLIPRKGVIADFIDEFYSWKELIDRLQLHKQQVGIYNAYLYLVSFIYENFYKIINENLTREGFLPGSNIAAALKLFFETRKEKGQVVLTAAGRSEKAGLFLQEILYHNGLDSKNVYDETVRALGPGDIVWAVSGSGTTEIPVNHLSAALKLSGKYEGRIKTFSITGANSFADSALTRLADVNLQIIPNPNANKEKPQPANEIIAKLQGAHGRLAPQGTVFEISAAALCAALGYALPERVWCCHIPLETWKKKLKNFIISFELELSSIEAVKDAVIVYSNRRNIKPIVNYLMRQKVPIKVKPMDDEIDLELAAQRFMFAANRIISVLMANAEDLKKNGLLNKLESFASMIEAQIQDLENVSLFEEVPNLFWLGKGLSGTVARFASVRYNHLQKRESKLIGLKVKTEKQWPGEAKDRAILIS